MSRGTVVLKAPSTRFPRCRESQGSSGGDDLFVVGGELCSCLVQGSLHRGWETGHSGSGMLMVASAL